MLYEVAICNTKYTRAINVIEKGSFTPAGNLNFQSRAHILGKCFVIKSSENLHSFKGNCTSSLRGYGAL